jgi:hypothetical protein
MRTFNGLQIFTEQLTNSGQLDLRYARITGNVSEVNLNAGVRIGAASPPTGVYAPGYSGQIAWDNKYLYICASGNGLQGEWWAAPLVTSWSNN